VGVIQWWVGAVVLGLAVVVAALVWWRSGPGRTAGAPVAAAGLDRVRALPGFRALVRREWGRRRLEVAFLLVAVAGTALLASRLVGVDDDARELRTREVVLCLDVSGSMAEVDADVIDTYLALVGTLEEERIGFVMFDAYAVTAFPLTNDHDYVAAQLAQAKEDIAEGGVPGAAAPQVGSSLIGDGLASCVRALPSGSGSRSRTVVLATDNLDSGDSLYTVDEAARLADDGGVMVFGVMPDGVEEPAVEELQAAAERTDGDVLTIEAGEPTNVATISSAITSQQKTALLASAQERSFDLVPPGALLLLLGLAGSLAAVWRRP
jgi:Ca-activated chloride channel homolog